MELSPHRQQRRTLLLRRNPASAPDGRRPRPPAQRQARDPARANAQRFPGSPARLRSLPAAPRRLPARPIPGRVPGKHPGALERRRRAVVATVRRAPGGFRRASEINLPPGLADTMRPYQQEGVRWLHLLAANDLGGILADEMGLGKTLQALAYPGLPRRRPRFRPFRWRPPTRRAALPYNRRPSLVVCPTSLVDNWRQRIRPVHARPAHPRHRRPRPRAACSPRSTPPTSSSPATPSCAATSTNTAPASSPP